MTDTTWLDEVLKPFTLDDFENHPAEYIAQAKATILTKLEEARIDELIGVRGWTEYEPDPKYSPAERFHIVPYTYLTNRIAELKGVKNK